MRELVSVGNALVLGGALDLHGAHGRRVAQNIQVDRHDDGAARGGGRTKRRRGCTVGVGGDSRGAAHVKASAVRVLG